MAALFASVSAAQEITSGSDKIQSARFEDPTRRYAHAVLGDDIEWGTLEIDATNIGATFGIRDAVIRKNTYVFRLPLDHVFEDIAPRLADVTGDGRPEVIVVETDVAKGAALAIYNADGKLAETPHIGRAHRWLAPIGAADLDGDGHVEIAYIDRPHLAKRLRVWRFKNGKLHHVADHDGLTNHRIGWDYILGGLRDCGNGIEMITANANWSKVMATRLGSGGLKSRVVAPYAGPDTIAGALACKN